MQGIMAAKWSSARKAVQFVLTNLHCMQEGWVFLDVRPPTEITKVFCFTVQFTVFIWTVHRSPLSWDYHP